MTTLRTRKLLAYGVAMAILAAVFGLYTRSEVMVALADQVWACFQ